MAKVSVACKLPHGLIINVGENSVELKGSNSDGAIGGHGFTENVDAEFMDTWLKNNADHPAVKNKLIFVNTKTDKVKDQAKEQKDNKNGVEGLDPDKPAPGITKVDDKE
jgi:hypothetical protein